VSLYDLQRVIVLLFVLSLVLYFVTRRGKP